MNKIKTTGIVSLIIFTLFAVPAFSIVQLDLESGAVFTAYNDVRIPGSDGTSFSLHDELKSDPGFFYRIRALYDFNERHHLGALFAPLSISSEGSLGKNLDFAGKTFQADTALKAEYKFNSYRLFYRYDFLIRDSIELGAGLTAKIRDAKIAVEGGGINAEKANIGFVPIINFRLLWKFTGIFAFLLEGDALVAPQGRAEDVFAGFTVKTTDWMDVKAGYRILEGGADNDEVYNFTMINYASLGVIIHF